MIYKALYTSLVIALVHSVGRKHDTKKLTERLSTYHETSINNCWTSFNDFTKLITLRGWLELAEALYSFQKLNGIFFKLTSFRVNGHFDPVRQLKQKGKSQAELTTGSFPYFLFGTIDGHAETSGISLSLTLSKKERLPRCVFQYFKSTVFCDIHHKID